MTAGQIPAGQMLRPWLAVPERRAGHLVMCPFAGAGSGAFRGWRDIGETGLDVSLAIYPGREHRMQEPAAADIYQLAKQLADELEPARAASGRLILAGHSMGAQVAFETCACLERRGAAPDALVLSGCHAPHLQGRRLLSALDDARFVAQLGEIVGANVETLADPALRALFLPMLRADFRITEAYRRAPQAAHTPLNTPALLVYGNRDAEASRAEVAAWRGWLRHAGEPLAIAGDHFYVTRRPRAFLNRIMHGLESIATCV